MSYMLKRIKQMEKEQKKANRKQLLLDIAGALFGGAICYVLICLIFCL